MLGWTLSLTIVDHIDIYIYIYKVHAKLAVEKAWEDAHHETHKALYHIISV